MAAPSPAAPRWPRAGVCRGVKSSARRLRRERGWGRAALFPRGPGRPVASGAGHCWGSAGGQSSPGRGLGRTDRRADKFTGAPPACPRAPARPRGFTLFPAGAAWVRERGPRWTSPGLWSVALTPPPPLPEAPRGSFLGGGVLPARGPPPRPVARFPRMPASWGLTAEAEAPCWCPRAQLSGHRRLCPPAPGLAAHGSRARSAWSLRGSWVPAQPTGPWGALGPSPQPQDHEVGTWVCWPERRVRGPEPRPGFPSPLVKGGLDPGTPGLAPRPEGRGVVPVPFPVPSTGRRRPTGGQVWGQPSGGALGRGLGLAIGDTPPPNPSLSSGAAPCKEAGSKGHCPDLYGRRSRSHDPAPSAGPGGGALAGLSGEGRIESHQGGMSP